jgi:hypothetical protein
LLTGTYANRAVLNQYAVDGTCPICHSGTETREHFLIECKTTEGVRNHYITEIKNLLVSRCGHTPPTPEGDKHWWTQLILDSSHPTIKSVVQLCDS